MRDQHTDPTHLHPPRQPRQTSLAALARGLDAIVVDILETPDRQRCAEIGLLRGAHVTMVTPGDPSLISLNGTRLAISQRFLTRVLVSYIE